jgi:integrating conjugative element membrane protein (TIGR03747 family)
MGETSTTAKPSAKKSGGAFRFMTTTVTTTVLGALFAATVMGTIFGVRSIQQHSVDYSLQQIDRLLVNDHPWLPWPAWVNHIQAVYKHWRGIAAHHSSICFGDLGDLSHSLPEFQGASASAEHNPFARQFNQSCSAVKNQILPLLTGVAAVMAHRCWMAINALPLLCLSLGLGLIDGLVQRDIRKFQNARESSWLFHGIKRCGTALFFVPFFLFMVWLTPVSPLWFFLPMTLGLGVWVAFCLRFFKKSV